MAVILRARGRPGTALILSERSERKDPTAMRGRARRDFVVSHGEF
jgi:hypothetical protein